MAKVIDGNSDIFDSQTYYILDGSQVAISNDYRLSGDNTTAQRLTRHLWAAEIDQLLALDLTSIDPQGASSPDVVH